MANVYVPLEKADGPKLHPVIGNFSNFSMYKSLLEITQQYDFIKKDFIYSNNLNHGYII